MVRELRASSGVRVSRSRPAFSVDQLWLESDLKKTAKKRLDEGLRLTVFCQAFFMRVLFEADDDGVDCY